MSFVKMMYFTYCLGLNNISIIYRLTCQSIEELTSSYIFISIIYFYYVFLLKLFISYAYLRRSIYTNLAQTACIIYLELFFTVFQK